MVTCLFKIAFVEIDRKDVCTFCDFRFEMLVIRLVNKGYNSIIMKSTRMKLVLKDVSYIQ